LKAENLIPDELAAWHHPAARKRSENGRGCLHFFLDDYRFERVWYKPEAVLPRLSAVGAALTPDFSIWRDMPTATQLWQVYRSRWCGAFWQSHGIRVIPTATWGGPNTYDFVFDTLPTGGVIAVSAIGINDQHSFRFFESGFAELLERCQPTELLSYGTLPIKCEVPVREYPKFWDVRRTEIDP